MNETFTPVEKRFLAGMTLTMSLRQLGLLLVMPFLSVYALHMKGGSPSLAGLSIGIYGLTQAFLQIPNGLFSDRIGRKPVVLITMMVFTAGLVLAAVAKNVHVLILARALQGGGAVSAVLFSWIGDEVADHKRNRAIAFPGMFVGITSVISFIAGPLLIKWLDMSHVFWICAGLSMISVIYVLVVLKESGNRRSTNRYSFREVRGILSRPVFLRYLLNGFTINFVLTSIFFMIPIILQKNNQTEHMWMIFVPSTLLGVPLMLFASRKADAGMDRQVIRLAFLVMLLASLSLLIHHFYMVFICVLFFFPSYMILTTLLPAGVTRLADNHIRGTVTATFNTFQFIGSFAGSALTGLLWEFHHLLSVLSLSILVILVLIINLPGKNTNP